jgi:dinuclear metal center YbgI/SA1388 family protein
MDVVAVLERHYPPALAETWDAVGLVCGDPDAEVRRVLFAVDPVAEVGDEAIGWRADLVVTHHPLFLRPVNGFPATNPKGRLLHRLVSNGVGLFTAHTNADNADPGVNDALGRALGLTALRPLVPRETAPLDKVVTFVPVADADRVLDALAAAGAGAIGEYDRCAWTTSGVGTFRPSAAANPTIGRAGQIEEVVETRLEMVLPRSRRADVVAALRSSHPYEEPAFDVLELAGFPGTSGSGRIGRLVDAEPLSQFARRVARALPATAAGVRAAGEPDAPVRTVAVCGGAGDSLLNAARAAGVDAFVTADLRHHPASEAAEASRDGGPALVDVAHWASEWPWLPEAADRLVSELAGRGITVDTRVSETPTDPWVLHEPSGTPGPDEGGSPER